MALANDLTNSQEIIYRAFVERLAENIDRWKKCGFLVTDKANALRFHTFIETGVEETLTATSDAIVNQEMHSGKTPDFTPTTKVKGMQFLKDDLLLYPAFELARIGAAMANRTWARFQETFFAGLAAIFATDHPLVGAGLGQVGAAKKYLDTGLYYNQTLGGAGTQDNKLTAALSATTFALARQMLREWRSSSGEKLLLGDTGLTLVVDDSNLDLALQITGSAVVDVNQQINTNARTNTQVVSYPMASDDDWFVIDAASSPVGLWAPKLPTLFIGSDSARDTWIYLTASYQATFIYLPEGDGMIGSDVP